MRRAVRYWTELRASPAGRRFRNWYRRRRGVAPGSWKHALAVPVGLCLVAAGIVLMLIPGPGVLVAALGLTVLASTSAKAARTFDWCELQIRAATLRMAAYWRHSSVWLRAAVIALAAGAAVGGGYGLYLAAAALKALALA